MIAKKKNIFGKTY